MPLLHFILPDGREIAANADIGESVMRAAVNHDVPGILGDCGGSCSCATCHAYVDDAWISRVPGAACHETELLESAADLRPNSRLTCEIKVTAELDGLVIRLPPS